MSIIQNIMERLKEKREERDEIPDDQTTDRYLKSLRREKRVMDEEEEKERLKIELADRKRARTREHMFGIKDNIDKKKSLIESINKKKSEILKSDTSILTSKKREVVNHQKGFLSKYNL